MSSTEPVLVWRCQCGFVESEPGACCRKCGTKNNPKPYLATLTPKLCRGRASDAAGTGADDRTPSTT